MPGRLVKSYIFLPMFSEYISPEGKVDFQKVANKINQLESKDEGSANYQALDRCKIEEAKKALLKNYICKNEGFYPKWDDNYAVICCDRRINSSGNALTMVNVEAIQFIEGFYNYKNYLRTYVGNKRAGERAAQNCFYRMPSNHYVNKFHYDFEPNSDNELFYAHFLQETENKIATHLKENYVGIFNNPSYIDFRQCYLTAANFLQEFNGENADALCLKLKTSFDKMPNEYVEQQFSFALQVQMLKKQLNALYLPNENYSPSHGFILKKMCEADTGEFTKHDIEKSLSYRFGKENFYRKVLLEIDTKDWKLGVFHSGNLPLGVQKIKEVIRRGFLGKLTWDAVDKQVKAISQERLRAYHSFLNKSQPTTKQFYGQFDNGEIPVRVITLNDVTLLLKDEKIAKDRCHEILNKINTMGWKIGLFSRVGIPKGVELIKKEIEAGLEGSKTWVSAVASLKKIADTRLKINYCFTKRDQATKEFYNEVKIMS